MNFDVIVRLAGPVARMINAMPDDDRQSLQAEIKGNMAPFLQGDGSYAMPTSSWGVS